MKLQRLGGYAAISLLCVTMVFVVVITLTQKRFGDLNDSVNTMAAVSAAPAVFYVLNLLGIVVSILFLIVLLGLHERMHVHAPNLTRIALIAGSVAITGSIASAMIGTQSILKIVPAQDISAYRALDAMTSALRSLGAYGWTCLLFGCAILRTGVFSKIPGWLWTLAGILWLSVVYTPQFGLAFIGRTADFLLVVSLIWIAPALLRQKQPRPASKEMAASR